MCWTASEESRFPAFCDPRCTCLVSIPTSCCQCHSLQRWYFIPVWRYDYHLSRHVLTCNSNILKVSTVPFSNTKKHHFSKYPPFNLMPRFTLSNLAELELADMAFSSCGSRLYALSRCPVEGCNTIFCREMTQHQKKVWIFWRDLKKKLCQIKVCEIWNFLMWHSNHSAFLVQDPEFKSPWCRATSKKLTIFSMKTGQLLPGLNLDMASHGKSIPQLKAPRLRTAAAVAFRQSLCIPRAQGAMKWQIFEDLCVCWWLCCKIFVRKDLQRSFHCFLCRTTWQWSEVPLCVLFPSPSPLRPTFRSFSEGSQCHTGHPVESLFWSPKRWIMPSQLLEVFSSNDSKTFDWPGGGPRRFPARSTWLFQPMPGRQLGPGPKLWRNARRQFLEMSSVMNAALGCRCVTCDVCKRKYHIQYNYLWQICIIYIHRWNNCTCSYCDVYALILPM